MSYRLAKYLFLPLATALALAPFSARASAGVHSTFLYSLANFHGKLPYNDVRVRVDRARDEVYVVERGIVRVFNNSGMEFFWFGDNPELESIYDLAMDEKGDVSLLSFNFTHPGDPKYFLIHCNYRGDLKEKLTVTGLPPQFARFFPNYMFFREGRFLFLSSSSMQVLVTDRNGVFQRGYNLADILEIPEKDRPGTEIFGFSLDAEGNMLFTVPVLFKAYVVTPDGKLAGSFGKPGSAPGLFGIVSGIARDDQGNYLVVERLRSVVMVFDKEFRFVQEFGYRGDKPANLIRPNELAIGNAGKLYVTQLRNRGVSVFNVTTD
ncbi:MAG: NHL repeat-containing protein [Desulfobacteria bacterium]